VSTLKQSAGLLTASSVTNIGFLKIIHLTVSKQGGVVRLPLYV